MCEGCPCNLSLGIILWCHWQIYDISRDSVRILKIVETRRGVCLNLAISSRDSLRPSKESDQIRRFKFRLDVYGGIPSLMELHPRLSTSNKNFSTTSQYNYSPAKWWQEYYLYLLKSSKDLQLKQCRWVNSLLGFWRSPVHTLVVW